MAQARRWSKIPTMRLTDRVVLLLLSWLPLSTVRAEAAYTSLREVPWRDFTYAFGTYVNGVSMEEQVGSCQVADYLRTIDYGDLDHDGHEEAVISFIYQSCGASKPSTAYVFTLRAGAVVQLGQIEGGDRGDGGIHSISVVRGTIIVRRYHDALLHGVCCPSELLVERWRFRDGQLVMLPSVRKERLKQQRWYAPR